MSRRRRRNPESELPYNEWIPAHAVMFGDDGSVSLMTEPHVSNPEYHPDRVVHWTMSDEEMEDTPHTMHGSFAVLEDGSLWTWDKRFEHWGKFSGPTPRRSNARGRRRNARTEDLRDGQVYVYLTNFGYYAQDGHPTLRDAIQWAKSRGFESQFVRDGQDLGSWTPFGGVKLKRQYEHEYY